MTFPSRAIDIDIGALVLAAPEHPPAVRAVAAAEADAIAARAGGVALTTCQRVEVLGSAQALAQTADGVWRRARRLEGGSAIRHVVGVALGLESAVLAEDQVLHQLRADVARARGARRLTQELHLVLDAALRAGRRGRSWRPGPPRSLADVAVECVLARTAADDPRPVLVVGAGRMGALSIEAARRRACPVVVASRTPAHAADLAAELGARAIALDHVGAELLHGVQGGVRGVVVAVSGAWRPADPDRKVLELAPIVVDLSVPGALPGRIVDELGDRHLDLDAVAGRTPAGLDAATTRFRRRLEELRERIVDEVEHRLADRAASDVRAVLAERIERERAAELDALWRTLPALRDSDRLAIEGMTRHLAKRLLSEPLARLGADPDGRRAVAARELFDL